MNKKALKKIFEVLKKTPWENETQFDKIFELGKIEFNKLKIGATKKRVFIRLCGQSGSGKTTQLLPSISNAFNLKGERPVVLAVRNFAPLYPNLETLEKTCPRGEIREKTNGFALRCLLVTLFFLVEEGIEIIYDVTILQPEIEKHILKLIKKNRYKQVFNILAINPKQSDLFILKRCSDATNPEKGRKIYSSSQEYFKKSLVSGLKFLSKRTNAVAIIWTAYDNSPVFFGNVKNCFKIFVELRKETKEIGNEKKLLESKKEFYVNFFS